MSFDKFIDFVSNPKIQSLFGFIAIVLAFVSCLLAYRLSKPKIKVKLYKNDKLFGQHEAKFSVSKTSSLAVIELNFENFSAHNTQIKDVYIRYKRKTYHAANIYTDYSVSNYYPCIESTGKYPIKSELLYVKVPFEVESFHHKHVYLTFYDFPKTDKSLLQVVAFISIAGKRVPKFKKVNFTRIDFDNLVHEYNFIKDGKNVRITSSQPIRNKKGKIISSQRGSKRR